MQCCHSDLTGEETGARESLSDDCDADICQSQASTSAPPICTGIVKT